MLASSHGYVVSQRHLKRMLNFRHKAYIALDVVRVVNFIEEQMQTSGHFTGYSCMQRERITRLQEKEVSLLAYFVSATVHT